MHKDKKRYSRILPKKLILKYFLNNEYVDKAIKLWLNNPECREKKLLLRIMQLKSKDYYIYSVWKCSAPELQEDCIEDVIKLMPDHFLEIWRCTSIEVCSKKIAEIIKLVPDKAVEIWLTTNSKIQKENVDLVKTIIQLAPNDVAPIWAHTCPDVQAEKISEIIELVHDKAVKIWINTASEVQEKNANMLKLTIEKSLKDIAKIWEYTASNVQAEKIAEIIELTPDKALEIWKYTNSEVQEKNVNMLKNLIEKFPNDIDKIWEYTVTNVKKEVLSIFLEKMITDESKQNIARNRLEELHRMNKNIYETINLRFLCDSDLFNQFDDEQILRITNYPDVQKFIIQYKDNLYVQKMIARICDRNKENNWIISLNRIKENVNQYQDLLNTLQNDYDGEEISDEFIEKLLSIVSGTENYFNIKTAEDVENFYKIREEKALKILRGDTTDISQVLSKYSQSDLYKFALLEYKFGIDLEEARRLLKIYGEDAKDLVEQAPKEMKDYAKFLEAIKITLESANIVEIVNENIEKIGEPWNGYPSAREAEGKIINIFEEIYNRVLYKPEEHEEDRTIDDEVYIDKNGQKHKIPVYIISSDFQMNVRSEGAYSDFIEPNDFEEYYNQPDIENHGNCECFIRSDEIVIAKLRFYGVMVGYSQIRKNNLTAMSPNDLCSRNTEFDIYSKNSDKSSVYRIPNKMIDNTRGIHNEMVKDRISADEKGEVVKSTPNYAVWIIEDREKDRERNKDPRWKRTKKLASQLNIPIVVIDREKFAAREQIKVKIMMRIVLLRKNNIGKYEGYFSKEEIERYKRLSIIQLASEILIKFDNNRIGLQFNEKLREKYFAPEQREKIEKLINKLKRREKVNIDKKNKLLEIYFTSGISQTDIKDSTQKLKDDIEKQNKSIEESIGIDITAEGVNVVKNYAEKKASIYNITSQIALPDIVEKAKGIQELFEKVEEVQGKNDSTSKVHGVQHVKNVLLISNYLGLREGISQEDLKMICEAAIYHDRCHKRAGDASHARKGAEWYLQNVDSSERGKEIAYLIEAHEIKDKEKFYELVTEKFKNIPEKRKEELIKCAKILQDADRLDILRYDIENANWQRFDPNRLNNSENANLISAVIELNAMQAIKNGYLQVQNGMVNRNMSFRAGQAGR